MLLDRERELEDSLPTRRPVFTAYWIAHDRAFHHLRNHDCQFQCNEGRLWWEMVTRFDALLEAGAR